MTVVTEKELEDALRERAFREDLDKLLDKHNAEMDINEYATGWASDPGINIILNDDADANTIGWINFKL